VANSTQQNVPGVYSGVSCIRTSDIIFLLGS
jgi:hypothetical protein